MKKLTKRELLAVLAKAAVSSDTESAHADADSALLRFIGDPEITRAYRAINRWYS